MAELRRPRHLGELQLRIHVSERLCAAVGVTGTGHAYDNDYSTFPATRATLPGFRILRASVDFDASRKVRLRLAADNLLDAEYARRLRLRQPWPRDAGDGHDFPVGRGPVWS